MITAKKHLRNEMDVIAVYLPASTQVGCTRSERSYNDILNDSEALHVSILQIN